MTGRPAPGRYFLVDEPKLQASASGTSPRSAVFSALAAAALVALQFGVIRAAPWELAVRIVVPATIAGVPVALWPHRRHVGAWVLFVGLAANLAVIVANGGLMPIDRETVAFAAGQGEAARYREGRWIPGSKDVLVAGDHGRL